MVPRDIARPLEEIGAFAFEPAAKVGVTEKTVGYILKRLRGSIARSKRLQRA